MNNDSIQYTTINTFKGLEADVVFVLDTHLISDSQRMEKLYYRSVSGPAQVVFVFGYEGLNGTFFSILI